MRLMLSPEERPIGYRTFRGKAIWFHSAWTTKAEAVKARDYEKKMGRAASIITKYRGEGKTFQQFYAVYSANN